MIGSKHNACTAHIKTGRVFPSFFYNVGDVLEGYATIKKLARSGIILGHDLGAYPLSGRTAGARGWAVRLDAEPKGRQIGLDPRCARSDPICTFSCAVKPRRRTLDRLAARRPQIGLGVPRLQLTGPHAPRSARRSAPASPRSSPPGTWRRSGREPEPLAMIAPVCWCGPWARR